jgi:hypothetical protein
MMRTQKKLLKHRTLNLTDKYKLWKMPSKIVRTNICRESLFFFAQIARKSRKSVVQVGQAGCAAAAATG